MFDGLEVPDMHWHGTSCRVSGYTCHQMESQLRTAFLIQVPAQFPSQLVADLSFFFPWLLDKCSLVGGFIFEMFPNIWDGWRID